MYRDQFINESLFPDDACVPASLAQQSAGKRAVHLASCPEKGICAMCPDVRHVTSVHFDDGSIPRGAVAVWHVCV